MSKNTQAFDLLAKLLVVGDSGVGKSCLLIRFAENNFLTSHLATVGVDIKVKIIDVEGKRVKVQAWDTAGQEKFQTITQNFYKGAMGIILTYAVNDRDSFRNIENWMRQIKEHANEDVCKILVGNKTDMDNRCIDYEEGKRLADMHGIQFFETSAKEAKNVNSAFYSIAAEVAKKAGNAGTAGITDPGKTTLEAGKDKPKKAGNCCANSG